MRVKARPALLREGVRMRWRWGTAHLLPEDDAHERHRRLGRGPARLSVRRSPAARAGRAGPGGHADGSRRSRLATVSTRLIGDSSHRAGGRTSPCLRSLPKRWRVGDYPVPATPVGGVWLPVAVARAGCGARPSPLGVPAIAPSATARAEPLRALPVAAILVRPPSRHTCACACACSSTCCWPGGAICTGSRGVAADG